MHIITDEHGKDYFREFDRFKIFQSLYIMSLIILFYNRMSKKNADINTKLIGIVKLKVATKKIYFHKNKIYFTL